jgi:aminobenzoyl-glutamate utilization protein B
MQSSALQQAVFEIIEKLQEKFWDISDEIWEFAELGLVEFKSSKLLADTLESAGFQIEREVAGMPTAFIATWQSGDGGPVIGLTAEYDALPNLSQEAGFISRLSKAAPGMDAAIMLWAPCRPWLPWHFRRQPGSSN